MKKSSPSLDLEKDSPHLTIDSTGTILSIGSLEHLDIDVSIIGKSLEDVFECTLDLGSVGSQLIEKGFALVNSREYCPTLILRMTKIPTNQNGTIDIIIHQHDDLALSPERERALREQVSKEVSAVLRTEIAEHHNTQVELRRVKGLAQSMINSSLDMMIAVDDDNGITEFNNAAQLKFGYSLDEVLGKDTSMLYGDPTQYDQVLMAMHEQGSYTGEIVNRTKDGEVFISYLSASRIVDESGKEIGSMGISRDVTQLKEAEKRSLEQAAKINAIFQSSAKMMIWTLDQDFRVTSCNESFQKIIKKGLGIDIALGDVFVEKIEPYTNSKFFKDYKKNYSKALKGKPQEFESSMINKKGEEFWVETFLSPIHIEGMGTREISCLAHEITDKKQAFKNLRSSLREKEILLQEVHHRVKNNLQVISSILNLQSSYIDDQSTLDLLKESQNRIRSMSYVHESLYQNKDLSYIDLADYVLGLARNLIHSYANNKDIQLKTKLSRVQLNLDQAIPCGLLMNELITNALKYAYPKGESGVVRIEVGEKKGRAVLRIGDDGAGLPKGTNIAEAPSLGLQLVSTLIEQLDGKVELEPKRGTNYLITFDLIS